MVVVRRLEKKLKTMITPNLTSDTFHQSYSLQHHQSNKGTQILIPDNHIHAILNLGDPIKKSVVGQFRTATIATGELHIMGCQSRGMVLESPDLHFIDVKIKPTYSRLIFATHQPFVRNESESQVNLRLTSTEDLIAYLNTSYDWESFDTDYILEEAIAEIIDHAGEIKIKEVYEFLGISKSHLEQKFIQNIGLTAKEFAKIEKLNTFMINYGQYRDSMNLTQLTFKSGYYDQSHFIKDFRYFMDLSPRNFFKSHAQFCLEPNHMQNAS